MLNAIEFFLASRRVATHTNDCLALSLEFQMIAIRWSPEALNDSKASVEGCFQRGGSL
jgi:hypothetical protein